LTFNWLNLTSYFILHKQKYIIRDLSWLAFNERVLQEAADPSVPLRMRLKFLGIFSNNLDEFFRVRVATLRRMIELGHKAGIHLEQNPTKILQKVQEKVLALQITFEQTWKNTLQSLKKEKIFFTNEKRLNQTQKQFILEYFNEEVRGHIVPLMIESIKQFPPLNDKAMYLACTLSKKDNSIPQRYSLIAVPTKVLPRFILLPSKPGEHHILLLEDVIRYCLPNIFSFFGYDEFSAHAIKVTRDAEIDIDNDVATTLIQKIEKGLKNRKKAKPTRLVFDKEMPSPLLNYLVKRLGLSTKDLLVPGGRIHNFKDFMDFPDNVWKQRSIRKKVNIHPELRQASNITGIVRKKDIMLHFPYHSFDSLIDLLREAAMDASVESIKITCYRLAPKSKVINTLINAVRNGKQVTVILELRARFDEEANLHWKQQLEDAGIKVLLGIPGMKTHAKICVIKRKIQNKSQYLGFVSTGNLNEKTAMVYGDHCLLTSHPGIMADINSIFDYLEPSGFEQQKIKPLRHLLASPFHTRKKMLAFINHEIKQARKKLPSGITIKMNSLSDQSLIERLEAAAQSGVPVKLIIRGICCMHTENNKYKFPVQAISIVDEYLEHARVFIFHHHGQERTFISSADWMVRNLDHRIETTCEILDKKIKKELKEILEIQLADNVKARMLNNQQNNMKVKSMQRKKWRSQHEILRYLTKNESVISEEK
jgi:polyphosphate kinase